MKNSELAVVSLVVSLAGYGGFSLGESSKAAPDPEPISLTINMPAGVTEVSAPLLQLDCDRDPEVTISGADINMHGGEAPAINVGGRDGE